jgi:hypothetical protein
MTLAPTSRIFALLSLLMPVMVISGGCMLFSSVKPGPLNAVLSVVADDPSYDRPPDAFFWRWFPKITRRAPKTGEIILEERSTKVDTPLVTADLQRHLKDNPNSTATAYLSSHGMTCRPAGSDTACQYAIPAFFVCLYTVNDKPQSPDYTRRYTGRIHLTIKLSDSNVVKSAFAIVSQPCSGNP